MKNKVLINFKSNNKKPYFLMVLLLSLIIVLFLCSCTNKTTTDLSTYVNNSENLNSYSSYSDSYSSDYESSTYTNSIFQSENDDSNSVSDSEYSSEDAVKMLVDAINSYNVDELRNVYYFECGNGFGHFFNKYGTRHGNRITYKTISKQVYNEGDTYYENMKKYMNKEPYRKQVTGFDIYQIEIYDANSGYNSCIDTVYICTFKMDGRWWVGQYGHTLEDVEPPE